MRTPPVLSHLDLAPVALGVDHVDARRGDREVVDICAAARNPAIVEDDHIRAALGEVRGERLLAGGAGVPGDLARRWRLKAQ
jgi:hypothetical protein